MKKNKRAYCPICKSDRASQILNLDCGNLDNSTLYQFVKINACKKCGHIYNELSLKEIKNLKQYYNKEYAPINASATYKTGSLPGGRGYIAFERYNQFFNFFSPFIHKNSRILDVGCGMGGFLDYLHKKGMKYLSGIDLIKNFVNHKNQKNTYHIKLGSAESIPFKNDSFDVLIVNQVFEHLVDPLKAFREAKRVLTEGGIICLGVPDTFRYRRTRSFGFYWFLMRDHLQHFDIEHLKLLAATEGFELLDFNKKDNLALSDELTMPNLNVIFRLSGKKKQLTATKDCFKLKKEIEKYITDSFKWFNKKKKVIRDLTASKKPIYIWGIGPEFLYMYESVGLKNCNITGLIDINSYKQEKLSINNKKIMSQSILKGAVSNSVLLISATAYIKQISTALAKMKYRGKIIRLW